MARRIKIYYKWTYGRSYTYNDKYELREGETIEDFKKAWKEKESTRKNPLKIIKVVELKAKESRVVVGA